MIKENIINRFEGFLELLPAMGKAIGLLFDGEFTAAGKVAADAVGKVALGTENITDKVKDAANETGKFLTQAYNSGVKIDELQKSLDKGLAGYTKRTGQLKLEMQGYNEIADDTNKSFAEREAAARKAVQTAKEQSKLMVERLDQEIELLKLKQAQNGYIDTEKAELAELVAKRNESAAQAVDSEKEQANKIKSIRKEARAYAEEQRQKLLDGAITKQKQELDLFIAAGSQQAKTQKDEIKFAEDSSKKKKELLDAELKANKITKAQYDKQTIDETNTLAQKVTDINVQHGKAALDLAIKQSKSRFDDEMILTQRVIDEENKRLDGIRAMKEAQLALEKDTSQKIIDEKIRTNIELTLKEKEFILQKMEYDEEYKQKTAENDQKFKDQLKQQEIEEKDQVKMARIAEAQTQYEEKLIEEDIRHEEEMARLTQMLADEKISKDQFASYERDEIRRTSDIKKQLAIENAQTQLGTMQTMANALGDAFGQSKELAIAQATMNAGQAILSIWSGQISGNPVIDTAIKVALTATTAISSAKQIKKIQSAKKPKQPKFEKGGLLSIGGNRHSEGGTVFKGTDGTQFEAEQGELIGVMNRNAARHFMAFNNTFPSGGISTPNYFAGGGILSREVAPAALDIDLLAAKISAANRQIPSPVVSIQDIISESNSYVKVREGANF
ncbi:MAG: hypothetical protein EOP55_09955 [Sphingobacteriales bacterium]|nr:MAG: hypothetical protein EOP55_09955 [Sphingobacteriales bacterium]